MSYFDPDSREFLYQRIRSSLINESPDLPVDSEYVSQPLPAVDPEASAAENPFGGAYKRDASVEAEIEQIISRDAQALSLRYPCIPVEEAQAIVESSGRPPLKAFNDILKRYRMEHPNASYREAQKQASLIYKGELSSSSLPQIEQPKRELKVKRIVIDSEPAQQPAEKKKLSIIPKLYNQPAKKPLEIKRIPEIDSEPEEQQIIPEIDSEPEQRKPLYKPHRTVGGEGPIPPLKKGDLTKYGYHMDLKKDERRKKLVELLGPRKALKVFRKLIALATLNKNKNPKLSKKFKGDAEFIKTTKAWKDRPTAQQKKPAQQGGAQPRTIMKTKDGKRRYVRRNKKGEFTKYQVDIDGKKGAIAIDRRSDAKNYAKPGFRDQGDGKVRPKPEKKGGVSPQVDEHLSAVQVDSVQQPMLKVDLSVKPRVAEMDEKQRRAKDQVLKIMQKMGKK